MSLPTRADAAYWDSEISTALSGPGDVLWYRYMDDIYRTLIPPDVRGPSLKTDLFEEARGLGPFRRLPGPRFGIDESPGVAHAALEALAGQAVSGRVAVSDVRRLPFADGAFGFVLSGSTLDHFHDAADLHAGLDELVRVLAPGGTLSLTLDNPHNPVLKMRRGLPRLSATRLQPYFVGETLTRGEGVAALRRAGLVVERVGAIAHAPRDPVMRLARLLDARPNARRDDSILRALARLEALQRAPVRWRSGYYLAFQARKPVPVFEGAPDEDARAEGDVPASPRTRHAEVA